MFPYPATCIMRIHKLLCKERWNSSTVGPQQGRGIYCWCPGCVSSTQPMQTHQNLLAREEPRKHLSPLATPLSARVQMLLRRQTTKQESPITLSCLSLPGIATLPGHSPKAWQCPSELHFSCGNGYMEDWPSKSCRFSAASLPQLAGL